jgi:inosose dehydratase
VIRVANAPCSWGVLEFDSAAKALPAARVLDEMAAAGYAGTELGDWGFLPTIPTELASALRDRALGLAGAFVPIAFAREGAIDDGLARAVRTANLLRDAHRLLADAKSCQPTELAPLLVLSDDNGTIPARTARAGRIERADGLSASEWDRFAAGVERVARAVRDETGLRAAFHHHCAGYVETPVEIDALMRRTSPELVGLCVDTGHLMFAGGNPRDTIAAHRDRIWHVHFKDCEPFVADTARTEGWDYFTAVRHGVFCELGQGAVPFAAVRAALGAARYAGWIVVEQDVLPNLGTPASSAARNREYLRRLGL